MIPRLKALAFREDLIAMTVYTHTSPIRIDSVYAGFELAIIGLEVIGGRSGSLSSGRYLRPCFS